MSIIGRYYQASYGALCGNHPDVRIVHFQWTSVCYLYRDLREKLAALRGNLLDVGCGNKPYRKWVGLHREYVGIDVFPGENVDKVIEEGKPWPLEDGRFDAVLCTQVLEHVADPRFTLAEIHRVLKPGGALVVTVPFAYNEHGAPYDFQRFSAYGLRRALEGGFEIGEVVKQGGIGTTLGTLFLNWVDRSLCLNPVTRLLRPPLLPFWIVLSLAVNLAARLWDRLDRTEAFYGNLLVTARKRSNG